MPKAVRTTRAEEGAAASLEVLPGVLAVQDDGDGGFSPAGARRVAAARFDQLSDEVVGGGIGIPAGVGEPDQVGQRVIAKRQATFEPPARTA